MKHKQMSEPQDPISEVSTEAPDRLDGETKELTVAQPQRGGGPKTQAGKLVSAQNARKHSFYATKLFHPDEAGSDEHQEFTVLLAALRAQHQPVGALEEMTIERIATEYIRFGRLLAFEREEFSRQYPFQSTAVERVMRYQAAIQRQLGQALTQLERLQRMRFGHAVPPPLSIDVRVTRELGAETLPPASSTTLASRCALGSSAEPLALEAAEATDDGSPSDESEPSADSPQEDKVSSNPEASFCETNSTTSLSAEEEDTMTSPSSPPA
jgi:hypothetical protein